MLILLLRILLRAVGLQGHLSGIIVGFAIGGGVFRWFDNYLALCTLIWFDAPPTRSRTRTRTVTVPAMPCAGRATNTCEHAAHSMRFVLMRAFVCVSMCVSLVRVLIGALVSLKLSGPLELSCIQITDPGDVEAPRADISIVNGSARSGQERSEQWSHGAQANGRQDRARQCDGSD